MVINMYTVLEIEEKYVVLENRKTLEVFDILKDKLPKHIKESDILSLIDGEYIIDVDETKNIKKDIRNRFNKLKG